MVRPHLDPLFILPFAFVDQVIIQFLVQLELEYFEFLFAVNNINPYFMVKERFNKPIEDLNHNFEPKVVHIVQVFNILVEHWSLASAMGHFAEMAFVLLRLVVLVVRHMSEADINLPVQKIVWKEENFFD